MPDYLPHRFRAQSVYRFVPILDQLLKQHSNKGTASIGFSPFDLHISADTAIARLRDAVIALSTGKTTHPSINAHELAEVWPLYRVTSDGDRVLVVPRLTKEGRPSVMDVGPRTAALAVLHVNQERFVETVTAFAVLLGQRLLQGEVTINGNLPNSLRSQLETSNDIAIIQDAPEQYHMI